MATTAVQTTGTLPQSNSRYRTLRGKSISTPRLFDVFREDENRKNGPDNKEPQQETPTRRSRSRSGSIASIKSFKRGKTPEVPPLPTFALTPKAVNIPPPPKLQARDRGKKPPQAVPATPVATAAADDGTRPVTAPPSGAYKFFPCEPRSDDNEAAEYEAVERSRKEQDDKWEDEVKRVEAETERLASEQKNKVLARLETTPQTPSPKTKRAFLDKLAFFSRSKKHSPPASSQPGTPSTVATTAFSNVSRGTSWETAPSPPASTIMEFPSKEDIAESLQGAKEVSERRVTVSCRSATISLPVTAETSVVDIMCMTSSRTQYYVNASSAVVAESFLMLGLERRIRRYERIRDVMNTWDEDHDNSMLILSSDIRGPIDQDRDLDIDGVANADQTPAGFTLQMHHSARPGKWNKRYIRLLGDGQILATKHADSLLGDKDNSLLCHMSDFDIYTAREAETRQIIKPPKRFCYAIKSQQPTSVFPEGENFVHFFSTDDEAVAGQFYECVHAWRSWYIGNKYREIERKRAAKPPRISFVQGKPTSRKGNEPREMTRASAMGRGPSSFRAGAFEPLLDIDNLQVISEEASKLGPLVESAAEELVKEKRASDESKPSATSEEKNAALKTIIRASDRDLAEDDLLGDVKKHIHCAGSQRRMEEAEKKAQQTKFEERVSESPTDTKLPAGDEEQTSPSPAPAEPVKAEPQGPKPEPKSWFPSAAEHTARLRSQSMTSAAQHRRPQTADAASPSRSFPHTPPPFPAMHSQRRLGKPTGLCLNTNFPEPPRFPGPPPGMRPPHPPGAQVPPRMPGTPMSLPRGRSVPRSSSVSTTNTVPPPHMRPRSRSTASNSSGVRRMVLDAASPPPPVPPLPIYSPRRELVSPPPQTPAPEPPRARPPGPMPGPMMAMDGA